MIDYRLMIAAAALGATACSTGGTDWPGETSRYDAPAQYGAPTEAPEPAQESYALRSEPAAAAEEAERTTRGLSDDMCLTAVSGDEGGVISAEEMKCLLLDTPTTRSAKKKLEFGEALITFDSNSAEIKPSSMPQINQIGYFFLLPETEGRTYKLVGHTDSVGDEAYNLELSMRRAEAVKRLIEEQFPGAYPAAILIDGAGETELKDPVNHTGQINRRVELLEVTDAR